MPSVRLRFLPSLRPLTLAAIGLVGVLSAQAVALAQEPEDYERCLLQRLATAPGDTPVGELRRLCQAASLRAAGEPELAEQVVQPAPPMSEEARKAATPSTMLGLRIQREREFRDNPFALTANRPNYFLIGAYSRRTNEEPFIEESGDPDLDFEHVESKFQVSFKVPLALGLLDGAADVYAGYTARSFWQLYDRDRSSPFRETNHEPEVWLTLYNDWEVLGWRNVANQVGFAHQSNGRSGALSRSWNRLYASFVFESQNAALFLKPWWRIPEAGSDDENPDIVDYLGHGEIRGALRGGKHVFSLMLRNHLESGFSKGTTELGWSFGFAGYERLRGYLQLFNGYGESLVDYSINNTSVGVGVMLNDWL